MTIRSYWHNTIVERYDATKLKFEDGHWYLIKFDYDRSHDKTLPPGSIVAEKFDCSSTPRRACVANSDMPAGWTLNVYTYVYDIWKRPVTCMTCVIIRDPQKAIGCRGVKR
jgi:hypothetical protein